MRINITAVFTAFLIILIFTGCQDTGNINSETEKTKASITKGTKPAPVTWEDTYNEYSRSVAESIYESDNSTQKASKNKNKIQTVTGDTGIIKPSVTTVPSVKSSITKDTSYDSAIKTQKTSIESSLFDINEIDPVPAEEVLWKKGAAISDDDSDFWFDD